MPDMSNDTDVSCLKTADPIMMPFGLWPLVGPRKHVVDGGSLQLPVLMGSF